MDFNVSAFDVPSAVENAINSNRELVAAHLIGENNATVHLTDYVMSEIKCGETRYEFVIVEVMKQLEQL